MYFFQIQVVDGPDDEGNMFERPGKVSFFAILAIAVTGFCCIQLITLLINDFFSFLTISHIHIPTKKLPVQPMRVCLDILVQ